MVIATTVLGVTRVLAAETNVEVAVDSVGRADRAPAGKVPPLDSRGIAPGAPAPLQVFTDAQGRLCQIYERTVSIDGASEAAVAKLCRQANGRWVLVR